jgi:transcription elongation GreA/GreB family factor
MTFSTCCRCKILEVKVRALREELSHAHSRIAELEEMLAEAKDINRRMVDGSSVEWED